MTDLHGQPPATPDAPISKHHRDDAARRRDSNQWDEEGTGTHPVRLLVLVALLGYLFWQVGWALPLVILGVVVMIFLHEFGHYLAAKWGGMKVTEFFIGFGPKIWSFQKGETEYGLKVIPAGAYVKIIGMNNLDEVDPDDEGRTYREKSYPKRMLVAVAGSAMHFVQALVLLTVLYAFVGVPGGSLTETLDWRVEDVISDSAADEAGLEPGDQIVEIEGRDISDFESFAEYVSERPEESVVLTVERDGDVFEVPTTIGVSERDPDAGLLGVEIEPITTTVGPASAVTNSFRDFGEQTMAVLGFFGDFFSPSGIADFAGDVAAGPEDSRVDDAPASSAPRGAEEAESENANRIISIVGAVQIGTDLTESGMLGFLLFFVGINITIGIFNLIPLLPLDGGHVVVATYERLRELGRPRGQRYHVDFARLIPVVYAVFLVLVLLGVVTIYNDITNPVTL